MNVKVKHHMYQSMSLCFSLSSNSTLLETHAGKIAAYRMLTVGFLSGRCKHLMTQVLMLSGSCIMGRQTDPVMVI